MSIEIFLDNHGGACYPGQTLAGRLECTFNKEKNIRAIRIRFKGRAETEWYESESYYDHSTKKHKSRRVRYSAEEVYFDQEYILVQGGENFMIAQGRHTYPFSYILPPQLPSSFEGSYGHIRYSIKGIIDRPWKFDYETKIGLNLISPLDLNYLPGLREAVQTSTDKNLCCLWCKSGPLTFDISLPSTGYCPGQDINIGACVQNLSNASVENVVFELYKTVEFISHYPSTHHRYDGTTVSEGMDAGIGAHGEHSWTSTLKIPTNVLYPNLMPCSIMNVTYRLKGKVKLPFPHSNLRTEFPVMIGSVPLSGVQPGSLGPPTSEYPLPAYNQVSGPKITPYPPGPIVGDASAPPGDSTPLLPSDSKYSPSTISPYPSEKDGSPYPSNNSSTAPYPGALPGVGAPYPGVSPSFASYPTPGAPSSTTGAYTPVAPSSTAGGYLPPRAPSPTPYLPPGAPSTTPYPPSGASSTTPYPPPGAPSSTSYPPEKNPYPPPGQYPTGPSAPYPSTMPYSAGATAPPSYEESSKSDEKQ